MNVYQIIHHEYDSDDGHYINEPLDNTVFADEIKATEERDAHNEASVVVHNNESLKYIKESLAKGFRVRARYSTVFEGDPHDVASVVKFATRKTGMTYYTLEELVVV